MVVAEYRIETELTERNLDLVPGFLKNNYVIQDRNYRQFRSFHIGEKTVTYRVAIPDSPAQVEVTVKLVSPIEVTMHTDGPAVNRKILDELYEDLFLMVQLFEEETRRRNLYFAFMPGQRAIAENDRDSLRVRIFKDSMLPIYALLLASTFLFFTLLGQYAPLAMVIISLALALVSGRLISRSADWKITKDHQEILLLQYTLSLFDIDQLGDGFTERTARIRERLLESSKRGLLPLSCESASAAFQEQGIACSSENMVVKNINVYRIVEKVAENYRLPMPKTIVLNSVVPNAAAAGPSAKHGTMMVTTGLLAQLNEDEVTSVIGHEMSHLRAHDPLVMSMMTNAEFILRFYVILPVIWTYGFATFWAYFMVTMLSIYFFGKFLESRADLDSVKALGSSKALADALRKIGFRKMFPLYKREPQFAGIRRLEWLQFDPHPPTYFRVAQLESISEPGKIGNTFKKSLKDNLLGFLRA
jgi:heat shock protein HtpX